MFKIIAAIVVIATALTISFAQDDNPPAKFQFGGGGSSDLPWEVIEGPDGLSWKISGSGSVSVQSLVSGLSTAHNKTFTYSREASRRTRGTVPYVAPDSGIIIKNNQMAMFVSNLLSADDLTLAGLSGDSGRVLDIKNAYSEASYVTEENLSKMDDADWAMLLVSLEHTDSKYIRNTISSIHQHGTGSVGVAAMPSSVAITGQVKKVQGMLKLIRAIDQPGAGSGGLSDIVRAYDLPAGFKASSAKIMIDSLFKPNSTQVKSAESGVSVYRTSSERVSVGMTPNANRIVVRATPADHKLVKQAIDAAK